MPARKRNPSKIPVSPAWVRRETERRLSRRSGGQSGGADQRGTDHSSPISLPSLSQPSSLQTSPAPALQSQEFGRIGDFIYSNEGTPIGSEISLVSDGSSVKTSVIIENPFSIFSPRPARVFDQTQSAPSSPRRSALSSHLPRADTDPCVGPSTAPGQRSPFLGVPHIQSLSWDNLSLPGVNPGHKIPIVSTPDSPLTPCTAVPVTESFVFPPPLLSIYSPHRRVDSDEHLDTEVEVEEQDLELTMAEAVREAMRKEDFALRRLSKQIRLGIKELPATGLRARGPGGVLEELESIKRDRLTFIQLVEEYEENYHQAAAEVIPVFGDVTHNVQFWNEEGEKLVEEVSTHRTSILNELQLMKQDETQAVTVVEEAEKREKRKKEIEKAKRLGYETDGLQGRVSLLLPTITDWSSASRQELMEAFRKLRDIAAEHDKMRDSFNDCEEAAAGKTEEEMLPVNMTNLRRNVQRTTKDFNKFFKEVTEEERKRGLRADSAGFRANVPFPHFKGQKGEDFYIFKTQLNDAMDRNNVANPDKYDRLRSCLSGDALRHVPVTVDKNFQQAMKDLQEIFGNPMNVMRARLAELTLQSCPVQKNDGKNRYKEIVEYCLTLEARIKALIKLAEDHGDWGRLRNEIYSESTLSSIMKMFSFEVQLNLREKVDSQLSGEEAMRTLLGLIEGYRRKSSLMIDAETQRVSFTNYGTSAYQGGRSRSLIYHANCVICKFLQNSRR